MMGYIQSLQDELGESGLLRLSAISWRLVRQFLAFGLAAHLSATLFLYIGMCVVWVYMHVKEVRYITFA